MADFAEKLGLLMGGVSQSELARRSGVRQATISRYLKKERIPSWDHVQALAVALGVSCEALRDDEPAITPEPAEPPKKRGRPRKEG